MSSGSKDGPDGGPKTSSDSESESATPPQVLNVSSDEVNYLIFR